MTDWPTLYTQALQDLGPDTPGPDLEQQLIDAYTTHPKAVEAAITKISRLYQNGKVHSPWGALKAELPKQINTTPTIDTARELAHATAHALTWITNAGLMYDRWEEVEDELWGDRGQLRHWPNHPQLRTTIQTHWHQQRPRGVTAELDELVNARAWIAAHKRMTKEPKTP